MKKEVFVAIVNAIKAQREHDNKMNEKLGDVFEEFDGWYNTDIAITPIEDALEVEFGDEKEGLISYFMYDLNYGEDIPEDGTKLRDGTVVDISTVEKLYDYLVK